MIDRGLAERIAAMIGGNAPAGPLPDDIVALAQDAGARVCAYTNLTPSRPLPALEAVDRAGWSAANIATMTPLLEPLTERVGSGLGVLGPTVRGGMERLLAAQLGALTGVLSQRVLGQYELALLDPDREARLLLVGPNLREAARNLSADRSELLKWVAVHEICHAVQFTGVPWLRDHLAGMMRELLDSADLKINTGAAMRLPSRDDLRALVDSVRDGGLLTVVLGEERRALIDRVQATMSLIEGHAEHVMDAVGADLLSSLPELRASLEQRRANRPALWRVLEKLLGLELKLRQYETGKRFCDEVVRLGGPRALDAAWAGAENIPTLEELDDPEAWLQRTNVPVVTSSDHVNIK
ncbi:MAG TPA: zinc-dependent metalloprotease [Solirubrobacteraceae bacterium]|nr:zinc-dependent metalloprotease [Solirubrobacteraceae bacterium]